MVYLAMLRELSHEFGCDIHAYVLMTNHVHLLATPKQAENISRLMKHLGQQYVQYFNRRHGRTGSLWEGRFKSSLVDSESYLLSCQRYIELNPVRARMVGHPGDYPWSSFHANALGMRCDLVSPHPVYLMLGRTPALRERNYRELFEHPLTPECLEAIRDAANGCFALGSKGFVATLEQLMQRRVGRRAAGRPKRAIVPA